MQVASYSEHHSVLTSYGAHGLKNPYSILYSIRAFLYLANEACTKLGSDIVVGYRELASGGMQRCRIDWSGKGRGVRVVLTASMTGIAGSRQTAGHISAFGSVSGWSRGPVAKVEDEDLRRS